MKLYPQMTDKIIMVAYVQILPKIEGFELPQQMLSGSGEEIDLVMKNLAHHYIITDSEGHVACISEGLKEVGLHSKFFVYGSFSNAIHIDMLLGS